MTARLDINIRHPQKLFINGDWVASTQGQTCEVIAPHTEEVIQKVALATAEDMDKAVEAAKKAFDSGEWTDLTPLQRGDYLTKLSAELTKRMPELCNAWVEQIGSLPFPAQFVIGAGIQTLNMYAQMASTFPWQEERPLNDGPGKGLVVREPVGVVAAIAPWNNPFGIMISKVAPALLAGCTVVMKPAPETPLEAYIIAEAAEAAGFPAGVINLATADRDASEHLVSHPDIDKVSFTGSVAAGSKIGAICGSRFARSTLELGGKSVAIVCEDFDVVQAANELAQIISMSSGQICAMLSRVLVPEHLHDTFVDILANAMRNIKVGSPYEQETQMGPLAMKRQLERVENYIALGIEEGATLVVGGKRPAHLARGYYIEPTLFTRVNNRMRIAQEEIFGPVLCVLTYKSEQEAIDIANDSPYGLYGSVYTHDAQRMYRLARKIRTGTMTQNGFRFDSALPFGGFKQSGTGREGGIEGLIGFTEQKSLILNE